MESDTATCGFLMLGAVMLLWILVATVVFTLAHAWVLGAIEPKYPRAFKISRGFAALVLTALGIVGLIDSADSWRTGFLAVHDSPDWRLAAVSIAYGHLISDYIWMIYGRARHQIRPRTDLILHHGLALVGYGYAMALEIGYGVVLLTMASELMPCSTAIEAWGKLRDRDRLQRWAAKGRFYVLLLGRIPMWLFALTMFIRTVVAGEVPEGLGFVYQIAISGMSALLALDLYWLRKCLASPKAAEVVS